jgi:8-oxo-dGTP diphosphatase
MRERIRDEICSIEAFDGLERAHIAQALAWVDSGAELCRLAKPATPPMHLVSYFVLVDDGHILLVDHKNAQLWLPAGGHVEPGEDPRTTVARELEEELGIAAGHAIGAPLMITCTMTVGLTAGHTDVSLWYVVRANRFTPMTFDHSEFTAIAWFAFADIPWQRADPHLARFVAKLGRPASAPGSSQMHGGFDADAFVLALQKPGSAGG